MLAARVKVANGESKRLRRYDKENLLWQSTVVIKSDPVGWEMVEVPTEWFLGSDPSDTAAVTQ